ncbi:hypothetical protein DFO67_106231 [Modicisalibacter xianhensis]|uniref:Uncharacterized protein n=1 Tax=Modicisalibacter xianhensis TaxID=442341 RepID=A0A4V6QAT8_9GAMM|nr:hypothetical protein DFO67_106231 [Halomonas xianhensis]
MPAPASAQGLTLALLVPRFDADDANRAITSNDLAVTAHFLDGSSNFHRSLHYAAGCALAHDAAATVAFQVGLLHHRLVLVRHEM